MLKEQQRVLMRTACCHRTHRIIFSLLFSPLRALLSHGGICLSQKQPFKEAKPFDLLVLFILRKVSLWYSSLSTLWGKKASAPTRGEERDCSCQPGGYTTTAKAICSNYCNFTSSSDFLCHWSLCSTAAHQTSGGHCLLMLLHHQSE